MSALSDRDSAAGRLPHLSAWVHRDPLLSDVLALGAYLGLSEVGVQVPRDMSVMGFGNLDWSGSIVPALTTINLPARLMGVEVAPQLMAHPENNEPLSTTELMGQIVERHSIAKRE